MTAGLRRPNLRDVLLPADMLPFLSHEDPNLRQLASFYLGEAHDPWPVTADDVWAAMDRIPLDERAYLAKHLGSYPLTLRSCERVLEGLAGPVNGSDSDVWVHLAGRLQDHPADDIRRAFTHPVIGRRLAQTAWAGELRDLLPLLEMSFDQVWEAAERFTTRIADKMFCIDDDWTEMVRLRRGLLRHPQEAAARALEVLRRPAPEDGKASWTQVLVVVLLEKMRVPEALGPLCDLAAASHTYFLLASEWAADAIRHLGTVEAIAELTARYEEGPLHRWVPRILGRIKRPESERALIRLFQAERRIEESSRLAVGLCELGSVAPEVIDALRDMAEHELFDPAQGDLDDHLLLVCAMHGWEPINAPHWRRRIAERRAARESDTAPSPSLATVRRAGKA